MHIGCRDARAHAKALERHPGRDPPPFDGTARRHTVIAIERAQQRRFARAIRPVYYPEIPAAYGEGHLPQRTALLEVDARLLQAQQRHAARPPGTPLRRGGGSAGCTRAEVARQLRRARAARVADAALL